MNYEAPNYVIFSSPLLYYYPMFTIIFSTLFSPCVNLYIFCYWISSANSNNHSFSNTTTLLDVHRFKKCKVKLSLCLTEYHTMTYGGVEV